MHKDMGAVEGTAGRCEAVTTYAIAVDQDPA